MADTGKRFTNNRVDLLSKAQEKSNSSKQQAASSSAAVKSWSTTTPITTQTPKVTNTAKAMPTATAMPTLNRVDVSKISTPTTTTTNTVSRESVRDLFANKTQITWLRKADTSNLLNTQTENKEVKNTTLPLNVVRVGINMWWDIASSVVNTLYEQWLDWVNNKFNKLKKVRENVTQAVWQWAIDLFKSTKEDLSTQWQTWQWLWATKDFVLNTVQWLPRWIARAEYWLSELLDWGVDAQRATDLKNSIKSDLDYWENTRTYKKVKETESFSDFLKNPLMYAWGTLWEMLPMFINAWVAVPTTFAQIYGETYSDYSQDTSLQEAWLNDNQIRLMSLWVAWVNTLIELWSDLVEWIMPWTRPTVKTTEKAIRRKLTKPFTNILSNLVKWWASEWVEEVLQNEMQDQVAWFKGSDRDLPTWADRLTTFWISAVIGSLLQWGNIVVDVKQNKELKTAFNEWSEAVDEISPWVSQKDKEVLFSAIVAAKIEDANMSESKVNKYETQTTELYNRIDELTEQLNNTTNEEEKHEINRQIEDANEKIKSIDEIINKWNAMVEKVNQQLQELSQKRMEEQQEEDTQLALEGLYNEINRTQTENLSEQTMNKEAEEEEIKLPDTNEAYKSFSIALKQPQNTILKKMSEKQLRELKEDAQNRRKDEWYYGENSDTFRYIIREINKELAERNEQQKTITSKKTSFKSAKDYVQRMIDIDKKNWEWSKSVDRKLREKYMSRFLRTNLEWDLAAHLPWLKWVNLKQIEGNLTDKNLRDIAEMLALVSETFWIDFNKVISDAEVSFNIANNIKDFLYNTNSLGQMAWKVSKKQVQDLIERTWMWKWILWWDLINMWVTVTLDRWPERAGSIMSHELWHLIDFALSSAEELPLKITWNHIDYTSIIEGDRSWKTFKKWTSNLKYYNSWSEILARYAEEYFAYKNAPEVFKELSNRTWYWSEEEFLKLLPKFESLIKDRLWAKLLDEDNQFYHDVVRRINEWMYNYKELQYNTEWMNQTETQLKLLQIETEYAWILQTVEWMKWDLKEEMEAYVQLSNLQSNYEMAKAKGEEYLEKLKTTPEQQETIDNITTTVLPPVETPENPNPAPPDNPNVIKLWLPYYWWSNIEEGIGNIADWWNWEQLWKSYMSEEAIVKIRKRKNKIKAFKKWLSQTWNDLFTPAITRIYNISPRMAWRLITMEAQTDINIHRYREKARWFVESLWKLKWKQALEVKMALLDYWALASEQWENIEEYKKEEVAKLKEVLKRNWFKEQDINDMFYVLNDIWQQYKDAWLDITLTDMYFPRVVKDYEWLIDYMNRMSDDKIKVNKTSLLIRISQIQADPEMTDAEKEKRIRNVITMEFKQPWTTSKHWKERKMWKLSDWWEWIFAYYENPIESIDHYITTMVNATQRQLFLWWLREDANLEWDIVNESTAESISQIIWNLVEQWMVDEDDVEVLQKSILAILNKAPSPKIVTTTKNITYVATITNFLSAINQLDDLWMTILKDRSWLKNVVKTIFGKANIKYDELWLEDSYEMFREWMWITNWLFKKSWFNFFDRLGKTSFVNAAWESMVRQAKNQKTKQYLKTRLVTMYWEKSAERMMEKIEKGDYKWDDWQIDIEILRDLLYQLGSTQPIFTSAMPTTYLNHPWSRLCYALSSFTLKRIDWLVQWTREVNAKHWPVVAWAWLMWVSTYLAIFWMIIWDAGDYLKWKKEDTFLWKLINEWIDEALKAWWSNALDSWLKIWDLSEYDIKTYKQQWLWWVFSAKIKPFVFDLWKDIEQAIREHDKDEITDLAKYVPIFWKLVYYWCWEDLGKKTKKDDWDFELNLDSDFDLNLDDDFELNLDDDFELNL